MKRKKILFNAPRYVQALTDYIEGWELTPGGTVLYLKNAKLSEVLVQYKRLSMCLDVKTQLSCSLNLVPDGEMSKEKMHIFRQLKGMEFELNWVHKRIFFREPRLVSPAYLSQLKDRMASFKISDSLIRFLSEDEKLMGLIQSIKPDDLGVKLVCFAEEVESAQGPDKTDLSETLLDSIIEFYKKPSEITWVISAAKLVSLAQQGKHLKGMIDILEVLSDRIDRFTTPMYSSESKGRCINP